MTVKSTDCASKQKARAKNRLVFKPDAVVKLNPKTLRSVTEKGLNFHREVEQRAATMFIPTDSVGAHSYLR